MSRYASPATPFGSGGAIPYVVTLACAFASLIAIGSSTAHEPVDESMLRIERAKARLSIDRAELDAAWESAQRCVELSETVYPVGDARRAVDLALYARAERARDHIAPAESLLARALQIVEHDPNPPTDGGAIRGNVLALKGQLAADRGDFATAAALCTRSHALLAEQWGDDDPRTTAPLLSLAEAREQRGDLEAAGELYRHTIGILEAVPSHAGEPRGAADEAQTTDRARLLIEALIGYGRHLANSGEYGDAERTLRQALALIADTYGELHPDAAVAMTYLGDVLKMLGRDAESLQMVREAVRTAEATVGPDHTKTATALAGLAHAVLAQRNNAEAERLFRRALRIVEHTYGEPHPMAAWLRGGLGRCLEVQLRFDEAIAEFSRAIGAMSELFGPHSFQVALEERRLGLLYVRIRRVEEGYGYLLRSKETLEEQFGPHHPYLCMSLKGLVEACLLLGRYDEARACAAQAVTSYRHVYGGVHSEVLMGLRLSALVELMDGNATEALQHGAKACEIALALQEKIYSGSSDREALLYSNWARRSLEDTLLGMLAMNPTVPDSVIDQVFSLAVRTHGQVLDRMAERRQYLDLVADDPVAGRLWRDYLEATQTVAELSVETSRDDEAEAPLALAEAQSRLAKIERELSAASERFCATVAFREVERDFSPRALAAALEPGGALALFVRYAPYKIEPAQLDADPPRYAAWRSTAYGDRYAAFCLSRCETTAYELEFVDLGDAAEIHDLIARYRRSIDAVGADTWPSARAEAEYRELARALYARLWAPLALDAVHAVGATAAAGEREPLVFLIPTGQLNLVDFNTLIAPANDLIIDRWRLHYLSSARDLLRYGRSPAVDPTGGLLVVGNPTPEKDDQLVATATEANSTRSTVPICAEAYDQLPPLPGAAAEARLLADLYTRRTGRPVTLLVGPDASEAAVKRGLTCNSVVHLATHGFFCEPTVQATFVPEKDLENPLLRSGLVLAGDRSAGGHDDGMLTAQEIVGYDLRRARWVVLSACGSALGRILPGEGLLGLRRAFEMAGARTVVTALWQIRDQVAQDLMVHLYTELLAGATTVDAVRDAQLARLDDLRQRRDRIHPALWGGIVAEGDWR
jgi:tetratricopeptide (TPR) repeat protein